MTPDEVFDLTKKNLAAVGKVDAIYFQGAVLDPIKALDKIESELKATVIASNPAMLWYVLSKLGQEISDERLRPFVTRVAGNGRITIGVMGNFVH